MEHHHDYQRVQDAMAFLLANAKRQPSMEEVAAHLHLSPFHFQRLFKAWAGISPKKFLQHITLSALKAQVGKANNLAELAEWAGLSAPSRVHDLFVNIEAVTPAAYKNKGKGIQIAYGFHATPFGKCLLASTERGICALEFVDGAEDEALKALASKWAQATLVADQASTAVWVPRVFGNDGQQPVKALLFGTPFQIKVWEALLKIPSGHLATYAMVAEAIGNPKASRAVGSAIGQNSLAYLIPCHRVIRSMGGLSGYKWGEPRKLSLIGWEMGR